MTLLSFILISAAISFSLFMASTPLSLGLYILLLALSMAGFISLSLHSWVRFLLFLIYIGGLLVIFAYFAAIQPNQPIEMAKIIRALTLAILIIDFPTNQINLIPITFNQPISPSLDTIYSLINIPILILLALVLFLALVAVVKISQNFQGPLRPFIYV